MSAENLEDQVLGNALKRYLEAASNDTLEEDKVTEAVEEAMSARMEDIFADLEAKSPQMLAERRADRIGFQARLYATWRAAFDLYEITWVCAEEAGRQFNARYRTEAAQDNDVVFDVLTRLHARACHTAAEVFSLLRSGQATGAMARWRSLHEVSVVMYLVRQYGRDLAQRYRDHEVVESIKAINDYDTYRERLGYEPEDLAILAALLARRDQLCQQYGASFKHDYGWAAAALKKSNPTIRDLEKAVKLDHLRPYYRLASHGIHANPKGVTFQLEKPLPDSRLIVEASNAGLADPGQSALISLGQCTVNLLTYKLGMETVIYASVNLRFIDEACRAFIETHEQMVREERLKRSEGEPNAEPSDDQSGE